MIVISACFRIETTWIPRLPGLRVIRTPMGEAGVSALEHALERFTPNRPALIVSTGFCGGLAPTLSPGELVVAETIYHRGEAIPIDPGLLAQTREALSAAKIAFVCGAIESTDQIVRSKEEKCRLRAAGALACDMESGPLARWAQSKCTDFLSLRAVLDTADRELPFTSSLVRSILHHPLTTIRLVRHAVRAGRRIGLAIPAVTSGFSGGRR